MIMRDVKIEGKRIEEQEMAKGKKKEERVVGLNVYFCFYLVLHVTLCLAFNFSIILSVNEEQPFTQN